MAAGPVGGNGVHVLRQEFVDQKMYSKGADHVLIQNLQMMDRSVLEVLIKSFNVHFQDA